MHRTGGSADELLCPSGGGEMVGTLAACTACADGCDKCTAAKQCVKCTGEKEVVSKGVCVNEFGSAQQPAASCKAIYDADLSLASGLYYVKSDEVDVHEAYCDMDTAGGGWEMLWKQGGGPENPNVGKLVSSLSLRSGQSSVQTDSVLPPNTNEPDTHGSGVSKSYAQIAAAAGLEVLRVSIIWKSSGGKPTAVDILKFNMGDQSTLQHIYSVYVCHRTPHLHGRSVHPSPHCDSACIPSEQHGGSRVVWVSELVSDRPPLLMASPCNATGPTNAPHCRLH
jgi:hypothetical protein